MVALNDAGCSEPGDPSDPIVIDVPGVQIAPYFVQMLNDCIALEHEKVDRIVLDPFLGSRVTLPMDCIRCICSLISHDTS